MKKMLTVIAIVLMAVLFMAEDGCDASSASQPQSTSGVQKATVHVKTGSDGLTVEQRNISARLAEDNKPGAIKHLYIISPFSGQVILYSTVQGKVTSGGKRLSPTQVAVQTGNQYANAMHGYNFQGKDTPEVLQDDGTYGTSGDYLYWWDVRGVYHQHYLTGGQIVHISSQPIPVKSVMINIEAEAVK